MRISINHNGSEIAEFNQLTITARAALGGYAFNFSLRGSRKACDNFMKISEISLSLSLSEPDRPFVIAIPSSSQMIQCSSYTNNSEQQNFEVILSKEQINALEAYRQEGNLKLKVGLRALTESLDTQWPSYAEDVVEIPRQHWLEALDKSGFRQTLLFEIPLPEVSGELMILISKAHEFIETGHYKDAVMQCRHIIEQVETLRDDKQHARDANKRAQDNKTRLEMTAIDRMLSVREQIKNVCQLGAHGNKGFTRSQARAVLGVTMALLAEPTVGFSVSNEFSEESGHE